MRSRPGFNIVNTFFLLVLIGLTLAFYQIIAPFLLALFVAAVLAALLYRPFEWINSRLPGPRNLSAVVTLLLFVILLTVPLLLIGLLVYAEVVGGYTFISDNWSDISGQLEDIQIIPWLESLPYVGNLIEEADIEQYNLGDVIRNIMSESGDFLISSTQDSFVSIANASLNALVLVVLAFFFLLDGPSLVARIHRALPLSTSEIDRITQSAKNIVSSTLLTTFGVGFLEGAIGTILFLAFGLPSPFLWGLVMVVFAILPVLGSNGILSPAGLILIVTGSPLRGILLIVLGTAATVMTQNVIRPAILGGRGGMHPGLVLLSTLGGLAWLGLIGFLIGPLIAALFVVIWTEFTIRFRRDLASRDSAFTGTNSHRRKFRAAPRL
ncbi:MAG: AI-2E family transporter [Spirochaetaceae bacterium]